ncbi:MAG: hypothetical protein IPJ36_16885 [Simplicispira sp.]|nr:hypothetical protein [Simplicispira sp.]
MSLRLPCDATTLIKFRRLLGEEGVEELLSQTITAAVSLNLIPAQPWPLWWWTPLCRRRQWHTPRTQILETARSQIGSGRAGRWH